MKVHIYLSGHDELRAYRPYRVYGIDMPWGYTGSRYAGLTCDVISRLKAIAIIGTGFLSSVRC